MIDSFYALVDQERHRQDDKWGIQDHPSIAPILDPSSIESYYALPSMVDVKETVDREVADGQANWASIALEEFTEVLDACSEESTVNLEEELIQLAAVVKAWYENVVRRRNDNV